MHASLVPWGRLLVPVLAFASICEATTYTVGPGGKYDYYTIQDAIWAASDGDEIIIAPGVYTPTWSGQSSVLDTLGKAVWIHSSQGPDVTIVDAWNWTRGLRCGSNETAGTHIEGLTIRNGLADGGGGMLIDHASPTITNCIFEDNSSEQSYYYSASGGAILNDASSPTIVDCTFRSNAAEYDGGAIYNRNFSAPTLTNCTFTNNSAYKGGALANSSSSTATLTGCVLQDNFASYYGGAVYLLDYCTITMSGCSVVTNTAQFMGGGVYNQGGILNADACTFTGNVSLKDGGGGIALNTGNATVTGCEFGDNIAPLGGGIYAGGAPTCLSVGTTFFCGNSGGDISGGWTDLGGNEFYSNCDQGACCTNDTCVPIDPETCLYVGGEFQGLGTLCEDVTCPTACYADVNGDGVVNINDLLLLISAWGPCP